MINQFLFMLFFTSTLLANKSVFTEISFNLDNNGNINPTLNIPIYYGNENKYYSLIAYSSSNSNEIDKLNEFSDSKNAFISNSKDLTINYLSYNSLVLNLNISIGIESTLSHIENNEFGYIHDSGNIFGQGSDYYISFDNLTKLDLKRHAISTKVDIPINNRIQSRLIMNIAPFSTIDVKQSTLFKPLTNEVGTSSSSTNQNFSYSLRYDVQYQTDTFFDLGLVASFNNQALKYDVAMLNDDNNVFSFKTQTVDTNEITSLLMFKIFFNTTVLGGLKPSIGYGLEKLSIKDNINGENTATDKTKFSFGFENRF